MTPYACRWCRFHARLCAVVSCALLAMLTAVSSCGCITRRYELSFWGDAPVTINVSGEVASTSSVDPKVSVPLSLK
jgi:hypothetical protein